MPWYAVYQKTDGTLVSVGTVLPDSLPATMDKAQLASCPDLSVSQWNPATLKFVPIPPPVADAVKDAVAAFAELDISTMTQVQLVALMVKALKFLVKRELARG